MLPGEVGQMAWEEWTNGPTDAVGQLFGADPEGGQSAGEIGGALAQASEVAMLMTSELPASPRSGFDASGSGKEGSGAAVTGAGRRQGCREGTAVRLRS